MKNIIRFIILLLFVTNHINTYAQDIYETSFTTDVTSVSSEGEVITYTYTISNIVDLPLDEVIVSSDLVSDLTYISGDNNSDLLLDWNETWLYTAHYTVTASDITNNGIDEFGSPDGDGDIDCSFTTSLVYTYDNTSRTSTDHNEVEIATIPAPTGSPNFYFCEEENPTLNDIPIFNTEGFETLFWYAVDDNSGTVLDLDIALMDGTTYYAFQTENNNANSLAITVYSNAVIPAPEGDETQYFCSNDEPTLSDIVVTNTAGYSNILWFSSNDTGGEAIDPNTMLVNGTTYYVFQGIGACAMGLEVTILVEDSLTAYPPTPLELCDDDEDGDDNNGFVQNFYLNEKDEEILNGQTGTVSYHFTEEDAQTNTNVISSPFSNTTPFGQILYVRVQGDNCASFTTLELIVLDCANTDSDGDGVTDTQENLDGTNPDDFCDFVIENMTTSPSTDWNTTDCDEDGVLNVMELTHGTHPLDPCSYNVADLTEPNTAGLDCDGDGIPDVVELENGTNPHVACEVIINNPETFIVCDTETLDGFTEFDLTSKDYEITDGVSAMTVTYHLSAEDANLGVNNVESPYTNVSNPQIIYVRVESSEGCFDTTTMTLQVIDCFDLAINVTSDVSEVSTVGDVVTYTCTVSGYELQNIVVTNNITTLTEFVGDTNEDGILNASEIWIYTSTYIVTEEDLESGADIEYCAIVNADDQFGNSLIAQESCTSVSVTPEIDVIQFNSYGITSGGVLDEAGDVINYTIQLYNWSDIVLSNVTVVGDSFVTDIAYSNGDTNTNNLLDPDENWTYNASYTLTSDDLDNMGIPAGSSHIEYSFIATLTDEITANNYAYPDTIISYIYYPDADGDGVIDTIEIEDETDPNNGCDFNIEHITQGQTNDWYNGDCDGDGISNEAEFYSSYPNHDTDNDGVIDLLDVDDDNDGILTLNESGEVYDVDGDNLPNYLDQDSDGDGLPDNVEAQDTFEFIVAVGIDTDQNGLDDAYISGGALGFIPLDTDGDTIPDFIDLDTDDDGISDQDECLISLLNSDTDIDGLDDASEEFIDSPYSDANGKYNNPQDDLPNTNGINDLDYRESYETPIISFPYNVAPLPYQLYGLETSTSVNTDDSYTEALDISFNFNFFGNDYNQLLIGDNGVITFDLDEANGYCPWSFTASIPSPDLIHNAIFGPYQDVYNPEGTGTMAYGTIGTAPFRKFVAFYEDVPLYSCTELTSTNQIIIYETYNFIDVQVEERSVCETWQNGAGALGIQNGDGTEGYFPEDRNTGNWYADLEGYRFRPELNIPDFQYILCDADVDGFESFDLNVIINAFDIGIDSINYAVFENMTDAEANTNELISPYTNTTNTQTLILRIEDIPADEITYKSILIAAIDCSADYDLDFVPTLEEDINNNGNFGDDDTDGDAIPDFIDEDDDGDYVLTSAEIVNTKTTYLDTDGDNIPNYLDDDDDGDGVLTIDEDYDGDWNPANDDVDGDGLSDFLDDTVALVGTDDLIDNLFVIYPNPIRDTLNIELTNTTENIELSITNIQGQKVYDNSHLLSHNKMQLDVSELASGTYFVKVYSNSKTQIRKIIIE